MLFGGIMCPFSSSNMYYTYDAMDYGMKIFMFLWLIYVPITLKNRLEQIIKLLKEKK